MGIDYRCVNGYIYISGNPVTDPAKIAERAEFFQARAGYYYANWTELYGKWRAKMEALIARARRARGPRPARVRARRGRVRRGPQHRLLRGARRLRPRAAARRPDVAAPLRVPAARLRRVRRRSSSSARASCPTSPTSTSRRWSPASTCCCSGPTPSCAGWRGWRSRPASTRAFVEGRSPARDRRRARRRPRPAASWLAELEKVKDPWFNMATGDGLYHYYRSWLDDPSIPYASLIGHIARAARGRADRAADRGDPARARPAGERVRRAARRGRAREPSTTC